jgi:hypothetical protein
MNWIKKREKKERKRDTTNSISFQEKNLVLAKLSRFPNLLIFLDAISSWKKPEMFEK